jgi:hypothetical protein
MIGVIVIRLIFFRRADEGEEEEEEEEEEVNIGLKAWQCGVEWRKKVYVKFSPKLIKHDAMKTYGCIALPFFNSTLDGVSNQLHATVALKHGKETQIPIG